ncbi:arrestin beta 2 [Phyllostomus discolor]|uniref:Beta-arrestin-2 n=1 Tax=Phyllostomus discolor TaxID=89673 RepID=A0A834DTR2_9CHIR|nr:arrestin beta 2 [Phyllostomus discolor]
MQCERGCQQGGAGDPGVIQGQGEAGGISRRVSVLGSLGWGLQRFPPALHCHLLMLPLSCPRDVSVELPFVLMHPKPHDHITVPRAQSAAPETDAPVDTNLIEFDTNYATDDDIVFEDFARLRLKGMKDDDYDDQFC